MIIGIAIPAIDCIFKLSEQAPIIPNWVWWVMGILGLPIAQFLAFHKVRIKRDELQKQLDNRAKRKDIRETLGIFLHEGEQLRGKCVNEKDLPPNDEANNWANKAEQYFLKELDASYITRFRSDVSLPLTICPISSIPHRNLWAGIRTRLYQLDKFIEQLGDE